jgi:hypothetical protein
MTTYTSEEDALFFQLADSAYRVDLTSLVAELLEMKREIARLSRGIRVLEGHHGDE